jgi:hypothetical protein
MTAAPITTPQYGLCMDEPTTLRGVAAWILRDPWNALVRRWNYKSAILSALVRSQLFLAANLPAGLDAAVAAFVTELLFRFVTSGFYGALTQAFRRVEPPRKGTLAAIVVLPIVCHSAELLVHWSSGTPALARSMVASVVFTALSTGFNVFAMRHGSLVVGHGSPSLIQDLRTVPRLIAAFVASACRVTR